MKKKLRIGIMIDNFIIPNWSYLMLEKIVRGSDAEIVLIIKNKSEDFKKPTTFIKWIFENRKTLAFLIYRKLDRSLFKCSPDAFEQKDISNILVVDTLEILPNKNGSYDYVSDKDLMEIEKFKIDVIIKLGFGNLKGDIYKMTKYGIWSYKHGDSKIERGNSLEFWEVIRNRDETVIELQISRDVFSENTLLFKSFSHTSGFSINRNLNNCYWKALSFLPSKIHELFSIGEEEFFKKVDDFNKFPLFYSNKLQKSPSNSEVLFNVLSKLLSRVYEYLVSKIYFDQWILLFNISNNPGISNSLYKFKRIIPPKDRFWADPFIIRRNDKYYIFFEELIYSNIKAHISLIIMDDNGNYTVPVKVLERDYHLSYPFLMEDEGEIYMIPETKSNKTIELYKCTSFPLKWELESILLDQVTAVDTTIIRKDGLYWLFAAMQRNKGASLHDELFLFSSESLNSSKWESHPQNPIVSDVKRARPAGNLFTLNGNLYRPSQNCSKFYGYAMTINQIIELNKTNYKEIVVDTILPDWDKKLIGTHTINSVGNLTVIDALMNRRRS